MLAIKEELTTRYGNPMRLRDICKEYFNLSPRVANERAFRQQLPVPVAKLVDNKTAPYMVDASELAEYIEQRMKLGADEWKSVNR